MADTLYWTPNNYAENYFGTTSQFNTDRNNLDDNSYAVNGITKGFDNRSSIGVLKNWNRRTDGARNKSALGDINTKFGKTFSSVADAQRYVNEMLMNASTLTGADMGSISVDGKWGDLSQKALDLAYSIYSNNGNKWDKIAQDNVYADKARSVVAPSTQTPQPTRTRLDMFTNDDIRNLGFRNYAGLVSAVGNKANANNNFVKAMVDRYGADTSTWNQDTIENDLGVRGTYRSFGRGDFGDMSRAMAGWVGKNNGEIDRKDLQDRTGSDGTVYSNSNVKNLFDKVQLKPKEYTFDTSSFKTNLFGTPKKQLGGQINMDEQQAQLAFLQYLMLKTGAQNEQQLEQVVQQLGEDGLKQAYAEFMQAMQLQQVQAAKFGAKLNYLKQLNGQCPEGMEMHYYKLGGRLCKKCMQAKLNGGEVEAPSNPIDAFKCGRKIRKNQQGKKLPQIKPNDLATRDSIAANRYNDLEVQINRPGSYKKNAKGQVQWTPDRTKAPYNKVTKHLLGGTFKLAFDNAYGKQRYFTWNGKVYAAYRGKKETDKGFQGAVDNMQEEVNKFKNYGAGQHLGWNPGANTTGNVQHITNPKMGKIGDMTGITDDVVFTAKRISPRQKANNQRKQYFDQWSAYVKKWHPNMLGRFKSTMEDMGYNYNWNTGIYSKSGSAYRLNNGQLQTQNIYTGEWNDVNNSDALPGMPANGLAVRLQK